MVLITLFHGTNLAWSQAYFTPCDDLRKLCIEYIDAEKKSIHAAIYMFTDKKIAQALINAAKRGVEIVMIFDQISMSGYGKVRLLQEQNITVYIHRTIDFNAYTMALMHHKFFIFGCNKENKPLVWTGSWNCTIRASAYNDENVIVLDDALVIERYENCFNQLRNRLLKIT